MAIDKVQGFRIRVRGLADGVHPVNLEVPSVPLLNPQFPNPVRILGHLIVNGDRVRLEVTLKTTGHFECFRCLEPFDRTIMATLDIDFVPDASLLDPENEDVQLFDVSRTSDIDLTENVRDALALAVPMKLICREDCAGICPTCGRDLNKEECACPPEEVSSTWSALKGLQERLRADEIRGRASKTG